MEILRKIEEVRKIGLENKDKNIGFVPTMGYLHEGHLSLIKKAREDNQIVIVSIYVNPMQFGKNEDLDSYPRNFEKDSELCKENGVDYIFLPSNLEMYPTGFKSMIRVEELKEGLCGQTRPTHFDGVCTIVGKLFNIVKPNNAYFGEKDYQQVTIIKRMVKDLNIDVNIVSCPIIREYDGLAKSSRNTYLSEKERIDARVLSKSLEQAKRDLENGERDAEKLKENIKKEILKVDVAKIDYIEIVDSENLEKIEQIENSIVIAIAVYIGKTRLIDNIIFNI